jgi:hypothetical protein
MTATQAELGCGLLAVLQARGPTRPPSERPPHTEASNLTEFVEQLRQRGVHLYVVAGRGTAVAPTIRFI